MLSTLKKFFDFCTEEDRKKFYISVCLGVLKAFIVAFRIPAIGCFYADCMALSWNYALVCYS